MPALGCVSYRCTEFGAGSGPSQLSHKACSDQGRQEHRLPRGGMAGAVLSCPEKPSMSRCSLSPPGKRPFPSNKNRVLQPPSRDRWPGDAGPSGVPVLCRAHRGARWVFGWRERVFCSGKAPADRATEPCSCFQRQPRKALDTGNSQSSDAVWFATPLI